jgi:hypothetical protein
MPYSGLLGRKPGAGFLNSETTPQQNEIGLKRLIESVRRH